MAQLLSHAGCQLHHPCCLPPSQPSKGIRQVAFWSSLDQPLWAGCYLIKFTAKSRNDFSTCSLPMGPPHSSPATPQPSYTLFFSDHCRVEVFHCPEYPLPSYGAHPTLKPLSFEYVLLEYVYWNIAVLYWLRCTVQ